MLVSEYWDGWKLARDSTMVADIFFFGLTANFFFLKAKFGQIKYKKMAKKGQKTRREIESVIVKKKQTITQF